MKKTPEKFDLRNQKVKELEFSDEPEKDIKIGEFWRYYDGMNIGNEIGKDGRFLRACLILHNALGNGLIHILPLTTKFHNHMKEYYVAIDCEALRIKKQSHGILNQIKSIDKKRFVQPLTRRKMKSYKVRGILKLQQQFLFKKTPLVKGVIGT